MLSSSTGSGSNDTNMVLGSATSPGGARGGFAGQWLVVGAVGLMLGLCTLAFYVVPQRFALVFVLALLTPCVMMAVGHVRRVLLAVIILDTPLQLGTFNVNYQQNLGALGAFAGLNVSLTTGCLIVLYALWLLELLGRVGSPPRPQLRASLPLALYIAVVALSTLWAPNPTLAIDQLALFVQTYFLYVYVVSCVRTRQDVRFVVTVLLVGLVLESLFMIAVNAAGQAFTIPGIKVGFGLDAAVGTDRVGGTIGSSNAAAEYLELLLAPACSLLLTPLGRRQKWLAGLAFVLGTVALVFTYSRGGWSAFAVSMTILGVLSWRRGWLSLRPPLAAGLGLALPLVALSGPISGRLSSNDGGATQGRVSLLDLAVRIIKDHPALGVGANNFAVVMGQYLTPDLGTIWVYVVHDKYLLVWAETGLGGLLTFLAFLAVTLRRGWQCWRANDPLLSPLALGFTAAVAGTMVHMAVDVFNGRPPLQQLWLTAALITAMLCISVQSPHQTEKRYGEQGSLVKP